MKIGDIITAEIENKKYTLPIYGEVYTPVSYIGFYPVGQKLAAVEVRLNSTTYEIPISKVEKLNETS